MNTRIRRRAPLGWTIALLLVAAGFALLIHQPEAGPHVFAILPTTTSTTGVNVPPSTTTTPGVAITTSTTSTTSVDATTVTTTTAAGPTTTTAAPAADNVLVGNRLLVRSATQDGADYPIQSHLVLSFTQDGQQQSADWTGGCNHPGAPVVIHKDTIDVGPIVSTAKGCTDSSDEEENFISALMRTNPHWNLANGLVVIEGGGRRIVAEAY